MFVIVVVVLDERDDVEPSRSLDDEITIVPPFVSRFESLKTSLETKRNRLESMSNRMTLVSNQIDSVIEVLDGRTINKSIKKWILYLISL